MCHQNVLLCRVAAYSYKHLKFKVMADESKKEVKFIQSLALAVNDMDGQVRHIQLALVQDVTSKEFICYMDVVDPSKVKLADEQK